MIRTVAAAGVAAAALLAVGSADLSACGDKSLSAGGIRMQRALAARYPAAVLIYSPSRSRLQSATRELHLQETLLKVGHKYREVATRADLEASVATGEFNVVLADIVDVPDVQQLLAAAATRPALVTVAYKPTKAEKAELSKLCRFLIKAPSHPSQYLWTIADAVRRATSPKA